MRIEVREADFADPSAGLRAGRADVALTRAPFDTSGLLTRELRADPVGAVLRTDDPLARRDVLVLADLDDRRWFRLPDGTDEQWAAYWHGGRHRDGPVVRTVHECLQAVLFNGGIGLTSLGHRLVPGLVTVPLADMPPSRLVVAWRRDDASPLVRSFVQTATVVHAVGE